MLHALCQLAEREQLLGDADFEVKPVAWIIRLDAAGKFLGFLSTHETPAVKPGSRKKPKPMPKKFVVPRQYNPATGGARTSGDFAFFLVDKIDYVLGIAPESEPGAIPAGKAGERHRLFAERIEKCAAETGDNAMKAVRQFLADVEERGLPARLPEGFNPGDLFAFRVAPEIDSLAQMRPLVRSWWKQQCRKDSGLQGDLRCLVTGAAMNTPGLFPKIKRVPGGQAAGTGLVSFNSPAFESYGWNSNENAPVSETAAQQASTALNRLLDPAFQRQDGTVLPVRHHRVASEDGNLLLGGRRKRRFSCRPLPPRG